MKSRIWPQLAASLLLMVVFLGHLIGAWPLPLLDRLENLTYDLRLTAALANQEDSRIVIVAIDERSLEKEGRWPWKRHKLATLVDNLFDRYQVKALGFDVIFSEKEEVAGMAALEELAVKAQDNPQLLAEIEQRRQGLDYDARFARALKGRAVVLGHYFSNQPRVVEGEQSGMLPPPVSGIDALGQARIPFPTAAGFTGNLPLFQQAALSGGFFDNPRIDPDGLFRRMPLFQEYDGNLYQSFPLAMVRVVMANARDLDLGVESVKGLGGEELGLERVGVGGIDIPVDAQGTILVPYRAAQGGFARLSATDVIQGRAPASLLKGAVVLVGATAAGLGDIHPTPAGGLIPGVEIHANIISGILDEKIKHHPSLTLGFEFVEILFVGLLCTLLSFFLPPMKNALASLVLLAAVIGFALFAYDSFNLVLPMAAPVTFTFFLAILQLMVSRGASSPRRDSFNR